MLRVRPSWPLFAFGGASTLIPLYALTAACGKKPMQTREGCDAVIESAHAAMRTLDVSYNVPRTCLEDKDCIEVERPSCISQCAGMAFPAKDGAIVRQRVAESDARECKAWREADCATIAPRSIASCATYRLRCQDTKCVMMSP